MIGKGPTRLLGMAIRESGIDIAEVHSGRGTLQLTRSAHFPIPPEAPWTKSKELGKALNKFLRAQGFASSAVIVGMPGRWLLNQPRPIPPTNMTAAIGILRMAIEREYQADAREWVFDFLGEPSTGEKSTLLLTATPQNRLTQVSEMLKEAGLRPLAVTSTLLALTEAGLAKNNTDQVTLYLSKDGIELSISLAGRSAGDRGHVLLAERFNAIDQAGATPARLALLGAEVRRVLASVPTASDQPRVISIWNNASLSTESVQDLASRLDMDSRIMSGVAELGVQGTGQPIAGQSTADPGAVALVVGVLNRRSPGVNFLKSKLAIDTSRRLTRLRAMAIGGAVLALMGILYFAGDWYQQSREVDDLRAQLDAMKGDVVTAQANVDRMALARGWYDQRPAMLDGMRALTLAFPTNGQLWTTSVSFRDDFKGTVIGKAKNERAVIDLLDRMRTGKRFTDVKLLYLRQADRTSKSISFALTFAYTGQE